jgi:hypothetical protein
MIKRNQFPIIASTILLFLFLGSKINITSVQAQAPTLTPTSPVSPTGIYITVITEEPHINVRMGPGSFVYPIVGTILRGGTAKALGRSPGGDWVQIEFVGAPNNVGWVYSPLVQVTGGTLQIVEPPPTPIPPATSTIDPTLAAQFTFLPTTTRMPTFTPPPSLVAPIYSQPASSKNEQSVPIAVVVIALGSLGVVGFIVSLFIRRR